MKTLTLAAAAALALAAAAAAAPAMAQPSDVGNMQYPNPAGTPQGTLNRTGGRLAGASPSGGSPGYQQNTYVRRPSARTPTDVGNMAFPDPSQTPAGSLPAVSVGR